LNHRYIGTGHLVLGLLRDENSLASKLLRENGLDARLLRQEINGPLLLRKSAIDPAMRNLVAHLPSRLTVLVIRLNGLIIKVNRQKRALSDSEAEDRRSVRPPDRLGDHASSMVCSHVMRDEAGGLGLSGEGVGHRSAVPQFLMDQARGALVFHERASGSGTRGIPKEKLDTLCVIGSAPPIVLVELIASYVAHCEETVAQILPRC
jgi:hypothetical protein